MSQEIQQPEVRYRPAGAEDVPKMADLWLTSVQDMFARNNVSGTLPPREIMLRGYEHVRSTGIFRIAESDQRMVAIAGAILRDEIWFLSAFWALPGLQRKGIGMPLLRQVWQEGRNSGATKFCTWSSVDITAMASYMKLGMLPGYEILLFEGAPQRLPAVPAGCAAQPLDKTLTSELDPHVWGAQRRVDHDLWSDTLGFRGRQVLRNGQPIGYYYLNRGGIGPAAWKEPEHGEAVMTLACREAEDMASTIRFAVPGINHLALRFAFESGLRLTSFAHFLTTSTFGRMGQYLPSAPLLL